MELYDPTGQRLYLTDNERQALAKAVLGLWTYRRAYQTLPNPKFLFSH